MQTNLSEAKSEMQKSISEIKSSFRWMYWTLVAIVIASVFAVWQINQTTMSNAISAMDYGRVTAERDFAILNVTLTSHPFFLHKNHIFFAFF